MKKEAVDMKKRFGEAEVVAAVDNTNNTNVVIFSPADFKNFHTTYMEESTTFKAFMSKVEGHILRLQDRMSTSETNIDTATKKADGAIHFAKSLEVEFNEFKQKMSEPTAIQSNV